MRLKDKVMIVMGASGGLGINLVKEMRTSIEAMKKKAGSRN
jgi:NAD(P)-dependent dehydrogenase (short-subunit alcohol dehydrogenase family)